VLAATAATIASGVALCAPWPAIAVPPRLTGRTSREDRSAGHTTESARAPTGAPLVAPGDTSSESSEDADPSVAAEADPLVSNGLGSPICGSRVDAELDAASLRDCETSGFAAAAAPTGSFGLDVHIDTGLLGLGSGALLSVVQDLLIAPLWMGFVWAVHALFVMLEWCFSLDLLDGSSGRALESGLAGAEHALTAPWLALALSIAAVLVAYRGLVLRRTSETLGEVLAMGAMLAGGLWLIADPAGTIGTIGSWSDQAGLGTLAVADHGSPATPGRALAASMRGLFAATVEYPWCYLEFGDVGWCLDPRSLDQNLRRAGLKIAAGAQQPSEALSGTSARLLRESRTNGDLFLALPANGPARNSINEEGSLYRVLCGSSEATNCRGPTAAEAEFRTAGGTWARLGGLLLIAIGLLGMLMLLGHIALRLLMAAILSVFYLLLAPGIVLAPVLGDWGRGAFRAWLGRLLGSVLAKLVFAFLLGVVFAVAQVLDSLDGLGWWTRWLLTSSFWWGAFFKRHQLLTGAGRGEHSAPRSIARRMTESVARPRRAIHAIRSRRETSSPVPEAGERPRAPMPEKRMPEPVDRQARTSLDGERPGREETEATRSEILDGRAQLDRIDKAHRSAVDAGDGRRAATLAARRERAEAQMPSSGDRGERPPGPAGAGRRLRDRSRFLDEQAAKMPAARAKTPEQRRDYPELAGLAGHSRSAYERLDPQRQRAARLQIDRELATRMEARELGSLPGSSHATGEGPDMQAGRGGLPRDRPDGPSTDRRPTRVRDVAKRREEQESPIMRDAREVAAGRKRQLGTGRP
jgi:TrbL/VirB6 plasmid conjugal transfer protein